MKKVKMKSANPILLSVVIPVSRMAGRLQNLEKSVNSCIHESIEVVLIHDIQDSDTENELRNLKRKFSTARLILESGKWGNPGEARNFGLARSSGEWIIFWDSDDVGDALQVIAAISDTKPQKSYIVGQFDILDDREKSTIRPCSDTDNFSSLAMDPGLWRIAMRREKVKRNLFLPLRMAEDQIFIANLAMNDSNTAFSRNRFYSYFRNFPNQLTSQQTALFDLIPAIGAARQVSISNRKLSENFSLIMLYRQRFTLGKYLMRHSRKYFLEFLCRTAVQILGEPKVKAAAAVQFIVNYEIRRRRNKTKSLNFAVLTGGLGNQLFQMSGVLGASSGEVVVMDCVGRPRSQNGRADLFDFTLPDRVQKHSCGNNSKVLNRLFNLQLSLGIRNRDFLGTSIVKCFFDQTTNLFFSIHLRKRVKILVAKGVGYDPALKSSGRNLFIGYFQSYKWSESQQVNNELKQLKLSSFQNVLKEFDFNSDLKPVLVVHVRLGDYRYEKDFGTLEQSYYKKAINLVKSKIDFGGIWLFSDEPDSALQLIPSEFRDQTLVIKDRGKSPAYTLELMRRGNAYVIGNSSFSWWGARLSYQESPMVVAPQVWFAGAPEPLDITHPGWHRV